MYVFQFAVGSGVGVGDETAAGEKVGVGVTFLPVTKVPIKYATTARIATPRRTNAILESGELLFGNSGVGAGGTAGAGGVGILGELGISAAIGETEAVGRTTGCGFCGSILH